MIDASLRPLTVDELKALPRGSILYTPWGAKLYLHSVIDSEIYVYRDEESRMVPVGWCHQTKLFTNYWKALAWRNLYDTASDSGGW